MSSKGKSIKYFRALHDHHSNGEKFPNYIGKGNADPFVVQAPASGCLSEEYHEGTPECSRYTTVRGRTFPFQNSLGLSLL